MGTAPPQHGADVGSSVSKSAACAPLTRGTCPLGDGACFPIHVDSEESVDGRRLTAILYLNPGWKEADAGQLRLYPPGAQPVDIAPLHDRLVIFEAHRLLHR